MHTITIMKHLVGMRTFPYAYQKRSNSSRGFTNNVCICIGCIFIVGCVGFRTTGFSCTWTGRTCCGRRWSSCRSWRTRRIPATSTVSHLADTEQLLTNFCDSELNVRSLVFGLLCRTANSTASIHCYSDLQTTRHVVQHVVVYWFMPHNGTKMTSNTKFFKFP